MNKILEALFLSSQECEDELRENAPAVLFGLGVAGFILTCGLIAVEAPKAKKDLDSYHEYQEEKGIVLSRPKQLWEDFKIAAPYAVEATVTGGLTIFSFAKCYSMQASTILKLASALEFYKAGYKELKDWKDQAEKSLPPEKKQEIDDEVRKNNMIEYPRPTEFTEDDIFTVDGKMNIQDARLHNWFRSNIVDILEAEKRLTSRLYSVDWYSYEELLEEIDIPRELIPEEASCYGWNVGEVIEHESPTYFAPDGNNVCMSIRFNYHPNLNEYGHFPYH